MNDPIYLEKWSCNQIRMLGVTFKHSLEQCEEQILRLRMHGRRHNFETSSSTLTPPAAGITRLRQSPSKNRSQIARSSADCQMHRIWLSDWSFVLRCQSKLILQSPSSPLSGTNQSTWEVNRPNKSTVLFAFSDTFSIMLLEEQYWGNESVTIHRASNQAHLSPQV